MPNTYGPTIIAARRNKRALPKAPPLGGVCYRLKQGSTLDLPKNITEVYGTNGGIKTAYTYSPYGLVTSSGNTTQPLQWSSEYADTDLGLVYYSTNIKQNVRVLHSQQAYMSKTALILREEKIMTMQILKLEMFMHLLERKYSIKARPF